MGVLAITSDVTGRERAIVDLFSRSFAESGGPAEGAIVSDVACKLLRDRPSGDIRVFVAGSEDAPVGCIFFSRLRYPRETGPIFLLSPVAVDPARQRQGVGMDLIRQGLSDMAEDGAETAMTYGDPRYYGRLGFGPVPPAKFRPPFALSQPEGWLATPLGRGGAVPATGIPTCVTAFADPALW